MADGWLGEVHHRLVHGGNAAVVVILALGVLIPVVTAASLPESTVQFWVGGTVDHCPGSDFSCPSTRPGVVMWVLLAVIAVLALTEERPDDE